MKTLQELYNEVLAREELKNEFLEAGKNGKALDFIKAHGCDATADEIKAFLEAQTQADKELSADELENVAGGCNTATTTETVASITVIFCIACLLKSATNDYDNINDDKKGRLCDCEVY